MTDVSIRANTIEGDSAEHANAYRRLDNYSTLANYMSLISEAFVKEGYAEWAENTAESVATDEETAHLFAQYFEKFIDNQGVDDKVLEYESKLAVKSKTNGNVLSFGFTFTNPELFANEDGYVDEDGQPYSGSNITDDESNAPYINGVLVMSNGDEISYIEIADVEDMLDKDEYILPMRDVLLG